MPGTPYTWDMKIPVEQFHRDMAKILDQVVSGEEMILTRDGLPIARLTAMDETAHTESTEPNPTSKPERRFGWGKDMIKSISPDFDAPLEEFREYME